MKNNELKEVSDIELEDMDMPDKLVLIFNMTNYDESNTLTLKLNGNIIYEFIKK